MYFNFLRCISYTGERLSVSGKNEVAFVSGKGIKFVNLSTKQERYFWPQTFQEKEQSRLHQNTLDHDSGKRRKNVDPLKHHHSSNETFNCAGTNCVAFDRKYRTFAIGEKNLNPKVRVYSTETFEEVAVLDGATMIEIISMDFSLDGKYLACLGHHPDHTLSVWDWKKGKKVASFVAASSANLVSFNPRDSSQLCTTGTSKHVAFWKFGAKTLKPQEARVDDSELFIKNDSLTHTWGTLNDVYVGNSQGNIVKFSSVDDYGQLYAGDSIEGDEPIRSMSMSKFHLLTGSDYGCVRLYAFHNDEFVKTIQVSAKQNGAGDIRSIVMTGEYIVTGTADGCLYSIRIPDYLNIASNRMDLSNMDYEIELIEDTHTGFVTGMISWDKYLVSCGDDGTARIWDYRNNVLVAKLQFEAALTGVRQMNNYLFLISSLGVLRIVDMNEMGEPAVVYNERIRRAYIHSIDVNEKGDIVLSFEDNHCAFLRVRGGRFIDYSRSDDGEQDEVVGDNLVVDVHGFFKSDLPLTAIRMLPNNLAVYVANDDCMLFQVKIPNKKVESENKYLNTEIFIQRKWRLDYPALAIDIVPSDSNNFLIVTQSLDKTVKYYDLNNANQMLNTLNPQQEIEAHLKKGQSICLEKNSSGKFVVCSGASDGIIWIRELDHLDSGDKQSAAFHSKHDSTLGGIKQVCMSNDGFVFSCGLDSTICVYSMNPSSGIQTLQPFKRVLELIIDNDDTSDRLDRPTISEKREDLNASVNRSTNQEEDVKEEVVEIHETLQKEFEEIWNENENAPDDEKLPVDEFTIDSKYIEDVHVQQNEKIASLKENIQTDNLKKRLLRHRIIEQCYESMETHLEYIHGLKKNVQVVNYPLQKTDPKEEELRKKLQFLRRVEEIDLKNRRKNAITYNLEGGVPTEDEWPPVEEKKTVDESQVEDTPPQDNDSQLSTPRNVIPEDDEHVHHKYIISEHDIKNRTTYPIVEDEEDLLYDTFDLYSRQRKVTQISLIRGTIRKLKLKFNEEFEKMKTNKETSLTKIDRINNIIKDIVDELEYDFEEYQFKHEVHQTSLEVTEEEIPVEKWVSPEIRKAKEEEERRKRARMEDGEHAAMIKRALNDMMDGKLEDKGKKKFGIDDIEKPACMDKPQEELTDAELKEIQKYEGIVKKFEEEEFKKRKQLEAKLKNAQSEIMDTCKNFDQQLFSLFHKKLEMDSLIYEWELKIIKLSSSILLQEESSQLLQRFYDESKELEKENTNLIYVRDAYQKIFSEEKKVFDSLKKEMDETEKNFKPNLVQRINSHSKEVKDSIDRLARMFKSNLKYKVLGTSDFIKKTRRLSDPFADIDAAAKWTPSLKSEKQPDNAPEALWRYYQEMRQLKLAADFELRKRGKSLAEKESAVQQLESQIQQISNVISNKIVQRSKLAEQMIRDRYNLDYFFRFKQGQVEIPQGAVITDYGDAILISKQVILDLNKQIVKNADENINLMIQAKDTKHKNRKLRWRNDEIDFEIDEMEFMHHRFQQLRVTKEMQNVLRVGHNHQERQIRERERLKDQIAHTIATTKTRIKEKKKVIQKMETNVQKTAAENETLEEQVNLLQKLVSERESIHSVQSTTAAKSKRDSKMKALRMERRLLDLSQAQTSELEFLKKEISKLRERTFPSFRM